MPRDETGWCGARAIVQARKLHLAGQDANERKKWTDPQRCSHHREKATEDLAREVGLGPGVWGPTKLSRRHGT